MAGAFVISLDFELHWGVRDHRTIEDYGRNLLGVREAVPAILELFLRHQIHATWATVGFLFFENKSELIESLPKRRPAYSNRTLSPYLFLDEVGENEEKDPYHFAPSLIQKVLGTEGQEIGTHTFSHYYCLEPGQDVDCFKADLDTAQDVANKKFGIELRSIVFPRNQFEPAYLTACKGLGFQAYRGNLESWFFKARKQDQESLFRRSGRLVDSYLPLSGSNAYARRALGWSAPFNVPASRSLRPFSRRLKSAERIKRERIRAGLLRAAETDGVYHLWWHPHNFGTNLPENLGTLSDILTTFEQFRREKGMRSMSMGELADSAAGDRL